MNSVIKKIQEIEQQMNANFIDRQGEIRAILLGILAEKNILFIGAPGVAKSSIIDQFMKSFAPNIHIFNRLISPTTQPEELFGSARFDRLKEGIIERNVEGQLPVAHFAFLDEIFKSTSDLLNGLLKIMNEHRFENGRQTIQSPLFTLIAASNEFPEEDGLEALYDRFLIRREVQAIKTPARLIEMLMGDVHQVQIDTITLEEIHALQALTKQVVLPRKIIETVAEIHFTLKDQGIEVSDRRTKHCLRILQANAVLHNRQQVLMADLSVLEDCLWNEAHEREAVVQLLHSYTKSAVDFLVEKMNDILEELTVNHKERIKHELTIDYVAYAEFATEKLQQFVELEQQFSQQHYTSRQLEMMQQYKAEIQQIIAEEVM